jgi:hypothetical protein
MATKVTDETGDNTLTGTITFYQHVIPPLESGNYTMTLTQTVSSADGKVAKTPYQTVKMFTVTGDRFTLNPKEFSSHFPPDNSQGEYSNVLPHMVFTQATLPWQRSTGDSGSAASVEAAPADVPPWLALLLFDEADPPPSPQAATVLDLLSQTVKTQDGRSGKLPANTLFPLFPGTAHNELDYGESWDDKCTIIDVPLALFNDIAPTLIDLQWLGHVRQVDTGHQSETYLKQLAAAAASDGPPKLSVVVGNRLPAAGSKSTVHLVSLENYGLFLPGDDGSQSSHIPAGTTTVRLVSLKSWSFTAVSEKETFAGLLLALNKPNGTFTLDTLQLPVPANDSSDADKAVTTSLNMGFVPLNHHTRQGDQTVSWYRGPFVPFNISGSLTIPVTSADAVTRYNPDTGMFDTAYAAAWQLGRLMALQNKKFAETLYNWKRENAQATISTFEENVIKETLQEIVASEEEDDLQKMVNKAVQHTLQRFLDADPND